MRALLMLLFVATAVAMAVGQANTGEEFCNLKISLVEADTGASINGLISLRDSQGNVLRLKELVPRGQGLEAQSPIQDWYVLVGKSQQLRVPRGKLSIQAFNGLETEITEMEVDTRDHAELALPLKLRRFYHATDRGYLSGNTHLHLQKISRHQADRYLVDVPRADGLDLLFLSYLERAVADLEYTSNKYTQAELAELGKQGVPIGNGEEHRHNFAGFGEGYGHVMLLNIPELVQPVSIGPGIMQKGTDGIPLRRGIDTARQAGATVIWCHNRWGLEDIPSWVTGRLHANNIFDGGTHGSYADSFYRYLDVGIEVPFSTGTDWFMYDFSRVYVPSSKPLTPEQWLDVLAEGKSYITNGPLLEFEVAGRGAGEVITLDQPGKVSLRGEAWGRTDFQQLQLISAGKIVHQAKSSQQGQHYTAKIEIELDITQPTWLALRTPPPSSDRDPNYQVKTPLNEYGRELFSHTSAVFVELAGKRVFHIASAQSLLNEMLESRSFISEKAILTNPAERRAVLAVYDEAIDKWKAQIDREEAIEPR